jgi:hypothetical protein
MSLRPALLVGTVLAAALGICLALWRWGSGGNHDLWNLIRAVGRGDELESHVEASRRRDEAKQTLANEVVAGRISLREAAEHFRRLNETDPSYPPDVPRPPGYERTLCESVLDYVWMVLRDQGQFAVAARWYADVFTAEPRLLTDSPTPHRYHAACAAVLTGCGQGRDAVDLDEKTRVNFRRQALDWLQAELEAERRLLEQKPETVAHDLQDWLWDLHLAGVRDPDALARLPEPERQAWHQLWAYVTQTLAQAVRRVPSAQRAGSAIPLPER